MKTEVYTYSVKYNGYSNPYLYRIVFYGSDSDRCGEIEDVEVLTDGGVRGKYSEIYMSPPEWIDSFAVLKVEEITILTEEEFVIECI